MTAADEPLSIARILGHDAWVVGPWASTDESDGALI